MNRQRVLITGGSKGIVHRRLADERTLARLRHIDDAWLAAIGKRARA